MDQGFSEVNRAVHLARRDACVERAAELLQAAPEGWTTSERLAHGSALDRLLDCAERHAALAMRSARGTDTERAFVRFLRLVHHNAQSVQALMENQAHIESEDHSFLGRLLGEDREQSALSALHCRRGAEDMLLGLRQIFQMAYGPYLALQRENRGALRPEEARRYGEAHAAFAAEMADRFPLPVGAAD